MKKIKRWIKHEFLGIHFWNGLRIKQENYLYPEQQCMFCGEMIIPRAKYCGKDGELYGDFKNVNIYLNNPKEAEWERYYPAIKIVVDTPPLQ